MSFDWTFGTKAITSVVKGAFDLIDQKIEDKDLANQLKTELASKAQEVDVQELHAQRDIIVAEATSDSWLAKNWRPLVMLDFAFILNCHFWGWSPPNISDAQFQSLCSLITIGLTGYVVSRSAEKVTKIWKAGK